MKTLTIAPALILLAVSTVNPAKAQSPDVISLIQELNTRSVASEDWKGLAVVENKLISQGDAAVDLLGATLNLPTTPVQAQWAITSVLGKIGNARAVPALAKSLETAQNSWQRSNAAAALEKMGNAASEPMLALLEKREEEIKSGAIWGPLGAPAGLAAEVLGKTGQKRAIEPILALLKAEHESSLKAQGRWGAMPYIKRDLIHALLRLGAVSEATPLLTEMANNDPDARAEAADALEKIAFIQAGKNPFEILEPAKTLDPHRSYSLTMGKDYYYTDLESGEVIPVTRIAPGSATVRAK